MTTPPLPPPDGSEVYCPLDEEYDPILDETDATIIPRSQPDRHLEDFDDGQ